MEGGTSELEIDSELVMSFYDQYQADELAGKVYGVDTGIPSLEPDSGGTGEHSSVVELKAVLPDSQGALGSPALGPDVSCSVHEAGNSWNLPDLLVGLEGGLHRPCSLEGGLEHRPSPPPLELHPPPPPLELHPPPPPLELHTPTSITIPSSCTTTHNTIQQVTISPEPGRQAVSLDTLKHPQSDSLLEALLGLGILNAPPATNVKSEFLNQGSPQYNLLDPSTGVSSIVTDLTTLQVPNFELSVSPKSEPGLVGGSISISSLDMLGGSGLARDAQPHSIPLDLIAQHCTLLPPDMVNHNCPDGQTVLIPSLDTCNNNRANPLGSYVSSDIADQTMAELSPMMQDSIKEEEDIVLYSYSVASAGPSSEEDSMEQMEQMEQMELERGIEMDASNPSYKSFTRCHLCVRIFSTKANLSSHIRHVHMGEAKHSRVKSIPCPHCQKMFSRKGHMTEHVRTVHEGKKRIYKEVNCQHCGKTFRRKWGLNIHISSAHADLVSSLVK